MKELELSKEEFSKQYIEPFVQHLVASAGSGNEKANDILEELTGLRIDLRKGFGYFKPAPSALPEASLPEPSQESR